MECSLTGSVCYSPCPSALGDRGNKSLEQQHLVHSFPKSMRRKLNGREQLSTMEKFSPYQDIVCERSRIPGRMIHYGKRLAMRRSGVSRSWHVKTRILYMDLAIPAIFCSSIQACCSTVGPALHKLSTAQEEKGMWFGLFHGDCAQICITKVRNILEAVMVMLCCEISQ
jgi:hypothetical protein